MRIAIAITSKDRAGELAILLRSLRAQTYQDFDVYIMDDRTATPYVNVHLVNCQIARLKDEFHNVIYERNTINLGLPRLRQKLINKILKDKSIDAILPIDDDVDPEPDYIKKLVSGLEKGFDFCSGVIPPTTGASWKRTTKYVKPMIDIWDGDVLRYGLDTGHTYLTSEIIPTHHFRSGGLGTRKFWELAKYPDFLGGCSFREEDLLSLDAIEKGMKFCVNTGAVIWHAMTPSGGNRDPNYEANIRANMDLFENILAKKLKEKPNLLVAYNRRVMELV